MNRIVAFALLLLAACQPGAGTPDPNPAPARSPEGGAQATGGAGPAAAGGAGGVPGPTGSAGSSATGGSAVGGSAGAGTGGTAPVGSGGAAPGGGGAGGGAADAAIDAPAQPDAATARDAGADAGESAHLPGRPDLKICKKEWSAAECCAFLCTCLNNLCTDSPKAKNGIASCMTWCPKLGDMARRCHVYHCYVSVSPTGGIKDHDSHCGHAADQVPGGGCPADVYR